MTLLKFMSTLSSMVKEKFSDAPANNTVPIFSCCTSLCLPDQMMSRSPPFLLTAVFEDSTRHPSEQLELYIHR